MSYMVRWFRREKPRDTTNVKFKGVKRSKPYEEPPPAYRATAPVVTEQVVVERIEEPQPEPQPEPEPEPVVQQVPNNGLIQNIFIKIKKDRLTKFLLALLLGILLLLLFFFLFGLDGGNTGPRLGIPGSGGPTPKEVMIGDTTCKSKLAITNDEQLQGLRFTPNLAPNECMIYIFNQPDRYPFWAKDMNYPMDIIFISADNMVTDLVENIQPCKQSDCPTYTSARPIRYAIEVNAGYVDTFDISIGDPVKLKY